MTRFLIVLLLVLIVLLIAALVVAVGYGVKLFRLWSLVNDPAMPAATKVAFYAALIYAICPVDLIPDPVYLDDAGVLAAAIAYITRTAQRRGLLDRNGRRPSELEGTWRS